MRTDNCPVRCLTMTFDLELLKVILGILSISGATVSGVAALLVEYKDKKTGRITKWGRYALYGIAISFLIGTSNLWIDYTQKSRQASNDAEKSRINTEKTLQIVTDINRTLNPFRDVRVTFHVSYPFDHPDLARYLKRLDEGVCALLPEIQSSRREVQGVSWVMDRAGTILVVRIHEGSPLFPNKSSEHLAFQVFFRRGLTLNFFKTPINPATFDDDIPDPDITMGFDGDEYKNEIEVHYDLERKAVEFVGYGILSKPESWDSSGKIVSMLDLPGTQMIVELEYDQAVTAFANLTQDVQLERINLPHSIHVGLGIADRRELLIRKDKFELDKGPYGTTNFVYTFPKSYEQILNETK